MHHIEFFTIILNNFVSAVGLYRLIRLYLYLYETIYKNRGQWSDITC